MIDTQDHPPKPAYGTFQTSSSTSSSSPFSFLSNLFRKSNDYEVLESTNRYQSNPHRLSVNSESTISNDDSFSVSQRKKIRLINRAPDRLNVRLKGYEFLSASWKDSYHSLLDLTWWKLILLFFAWYITIHIIWGTLYWFDIDGVSNADDWLDCVFFSVQSMETIGYGRLAPTSDYVNFLIGAQSALSILVTAVITGLTFAKISRPSRIRRKYRFSQMALINQEFPYYDKSTKRYSRRTESGHHLMNNHENNNNNTINNHDNANLLGFGKNTVLVFRIVNLRKTQLCTPMFHLLLLCKESKDTLGPEPIPKKPAAKYVIHELDFELNQIIGRPRECAMSVPLAGLPWTIYHHINEESPLYGKTYQDLQELEAEIIGVLDGIDEAVSDNVQVRWSYTPDELVWNAKFEEVVFRDYQSGQYVVDLNRFDRYVHV